MPKVRWTRALQEQIVASIRAGAYPHVAAAAFGVPAKVFAEWMALGQRKGARPPYANFAAEVDQAHAQVRVRAEADALKNDPRAWLTNGPGRESETGLGWSTSVKAREGAAAGQAFQVELAELFRALLEALLPFPEARAAAARKLYDLGFADKAEKEFKCEAPSPSG